MEVKACYQLSDASAPGHGQTLFNPGSHRLRSELPTGASQHPDNFIEPLLKPGDMVLFENRTYHTVGHNTSNITRKIL